ncbi:hypothetical protein [Chitinimonas sp.]|uniref:hypothetical protein n=1 Tax=Chitinimonas sp. TaxID=1934313 RepID=UPI0035B3F7B0
MNIWAWVGQLQRDLREAGYGRVADLMDDIPSDTDGNRPQRVDAALPEAIAAARALKNPWLEVFFRHWGLQNRFTNRSEGELALDETVALYEFAHRPETDGCPQAICVTQDIAICYANVDAPGWAQARLDVSRETLDRINPDWPCFTCISTEYAQALIDAGRAAEACDFVELQLAALRQAGQPVRASWYDTLSWALEESGRLDEALAALREAERIEGNDGDRKDQQDRAIARTRILVLQGKPDEAAEQLPAHGDLLAGSWYGWAEAATMLLRAQPERNHWQVGAGIYTSLLHASRVGAHYKASCMALWHAELALARGARDSAGRALAIGHAHLLKLKKPEELAPSFAKLQAAWQETAAVSTPLPVPAEQLYAWMQERESPNPEQDLEWLAAACAALPADGDLAGQYASALRACGLVDEAEAQLWQFVKAYPDSDGPNYTLLGLLLDQGKTTEVAELANAIEAANPAAALWCRARLAWIAKQYNETCNLLQRYVDLRPEAYGARVLWAQAALAAGDLAQAVAQRKALCAMDKDDRSAIWDLTTVASAAQDWPTVRDCAAKLDIQLDTAEGPIEERWSNVLIAFDEDGERKTYYALRTGPATARIQAPSRVPDRQHVRDWVAFDATPLEPWPEDEAERADFLPTFLALHVIEPGGFGESCFVDGAHPGEAHLRAFTEAIDAMGWEYWISSSAEYQVSNPDGGEPLAGLFFRVVAPAEVSASELDQRLLALTADWPHPACWPQFADRNSLGMERHIAIVERYDL